MPKLTELTATASLSNSDLLAVSTNTSGVAVSNSANVATFVTKVMEQSASDLASHVKFTVDTEGNTAFKFTGGGADQSNNETLYLYRGFTYQFSLNANVNQGNSHLFEIRESDGGDYYVNGQSNASGNVIYFTVPQNASGNLVYQCNTHTDMIGTIVIL